MPHLLQVLKGVKVQAEKLAELLVPGFLLLLLFLWNSEKSGFKEPHLTTQMIWAAATITFSFCHSGETTVPGEAVYDPEVHLSYSDLTVDNPLALQAISIKIKPSKTGKCRSGYKGVLGRTDNCLCPVSALLSYLALCGNLTGSLFHWQNNKTLQAQVCETWAKSSLIS